MPDLPELYEALDAELKRLFNNMSKRYVGEWDWDQEVTDSSSRLVSALSAAIEVKQSQELHDLLNDKEWRSSEEMFDKRDEEKGENNEF